MPNYVYSTLTLEGSEDDIKKFREKYENNFDGKLDANNSLPYPMEFYILDKNKENLALTDEEQKELTLIALEGKYDTNRDGYNQGGYDWNIANWGTKWNFCNSVIDKISKTEITYSFETAWNKITPVIIEMSNSFKDIYFSYYCDEESGEFRDETAYKGGKEIDFIDRTHEIAIERQQEEDDYNLGVEEDRIMEDKINNG